ncbi:hypothetical protein [Marinifilum fragile]|uniref:hypothetical protein n=1 Tax=Marinifilum fragile TaxID=570161 RepID=UPI002AA7D59F|nr:hypothetical protein [Marinifilum fragile]
MMIEFDKVLKESLWNNSIIFLKDAIERIVSTNIDREIGTERGLILLTCSSIQVSMELALKSFIIDNYGVRSILVSSQYRMQDDEIIRLYNSNKIRTKTFEELKKFLKQNNNNILTEDDYDIISDFQKFRNIIVHFIPNLSDGDYFDLEYDVIQYAIHVLIKILKNGDDLIKSSEFLEHHLGWELREKLIKYEPYLHAMSSLVRQNSDKVFDCINCGHRTFSMEEQICYSCNFENHFYYLIDCCFCKEKKSVIYDNLNIKGNNHIMKGVCLNCGEDGMIYQCPDCERAHNIEVNCENQCLPGKCINK